MSNQFAAVCPAVACKQGDEFNMAKEQKGSQPRPRRAAGSSGSATPGKSKAPKSDADDDDIDVADRAEGAEPQQASNRADDAEPYLLNALKLSPNHPMANTTLGMVKIR